jgi:IclR family KDG regulon transcriptional repressor
MARRVDSQATVSSYRIRSLDIALSILDLFDLEHMHLSSSEVALQIGVHKSVVFRALQTLKARQYVSQDPATKKYTLGSRILKLGATCAATMGLSHSVQRILDSTAVQAGENVTFAMLDGSEVVHISQALSSQPLQSNVGGRGTRRPCHCTALGRAMLSVLPEADLQKLLSTCEFQKYTPRSISNIKSLRLELERVRRRGCAWARDELLEGVTCVAAPVRSASTRQVLAVSIDLPTSRCTQQKEPVLEALIAEASRRLTSVVQQFEFLGAPPTSPK